MRNIFLLLLLSFICVTSYAQKRGHLLTYGLHVGDNLFIEENQNNSQLGYGFHVEYTYAWTRHWGVKSGIRASQYKHKSIIDHHYQEFTNLTNYDMTPYTAMVNMDNWTEVENTTFIEIPLELVYQNDIQIGRLGWYASLGAKYQMPIISMYKVTEGSISVDGYANNTTLTDVPLKGINAETGLPDGSLDVNPTLAATGSIGLLYSLGRRNDFRIGLRADYGLSNVIDANDQCLRLNQEGVTDYLEASPNTGCSTMAVVLEFGFRYKL